jgi:hypothetical protein
MSAEPANIKEEVTSTSEVTDSVTTATKSAGEKSAETAKVINLSTDKSF